MEVEAEADVLDLLGEELAVGGVPAVVLQEQLEVAAGQDAVELHAGTHREVDVPVGLLALLDVDAQDRPPPRGTRRPSRRRSAEARRWRRAAPRAPNCE